MVNEKLYIIMRSDMASMNSGKGMAQASHASNAFVKHANNARYDISAWEESTPQGFGTVYVLDGGSIESIRKAVDPLIELGLIAGYVNDPTYPVVDGKVFHAINIDTCAYVYCDEYSQSFVKMALSDFGLHP